MEEQYIYFAIKVISTLIFISIFSIIFYMPNTIIDRAIDRTIQIIKKVTRGHVRR